MPVVRDGVPHIFHHVWPIASRYRFAPSLMIELQAMISSYDLVHVHWLYNFACVAAARAAVAANVPFVDPASGEPRSASAEEERHGQAGVSRDYWPAAPDPRIGGRVHRRGRTPTGVVRTAPARVGDSERSRSVASTNGSHRQERSALPFRPSVARTCCSWVASVARRGWTCSCRPFSVRCSGGRSCGWSWRGRVTRATRPMCAPWHRGSALRIECYFRA